MLFGLGALGPRLAVEVAPTATAAASVVLIVVELRVVPGWWLGAAVQEVGEGVGCEGCLGRHQGLLVLGIICCRIQVPQRTGQP